MSSINNSPLNLNNLTNNRSVSFSSLQDIANGKYNMGEVVAKKGTFGGIVFDKINNHVTNTEKNGVKSSVADNQFMKAAVFKAILEHYGAIDGKDAIQNIANAELTGMGVGTDKPGTTPSEAFSRISNPYVKEAFKFLMLNGMDEAPLSRDELKLLLTQLDDWEKNVGQQLQDQGASFAVAKKRAGEKNMSLADSLRQQGLGSSNKSEIERLVTLHTFKVTGKSECSTRTQSDQLKADIRGWNVSGLDSQTQILLGEVTENQEGFAVTHPNVSLKMDESVKLDAKSSEADNALEEVIVANAYGSREGSDGGEGYMGVINGKVIKCLTHSQERKNIGEGLTDEQKTAVNKMTAELRSKLTAMAEKLPPGAEKDEIVQLLAPKEDDIDAHNGLDLLSRKTVARVAKLLAKGAPKLFNWEGLKAAKTVAHTSFAAVLARGTRTEREIQNLKAKSLHIIQTSVALKDMHATEKYKAFVELLTDPDRVKSAAAEVDAALKKRGLETPIMSCHGADIAHPNSVTDMKAQYQDSDKFTAATQRKIQAEGIQTKDGKTERISAEQTCMQVFADGHFFGGGIGKAFPSQEEATLTDELDPRVAAWMLEKGMIKLSEYNGVLGFEYVNQSTVDGGYILTDPFSGKNFAFHSMPSLDIENDYNHDILGNTNWVCMAREVKTGTETTPEMRDNAFKFITKFYEVVGTGDGFIKEVHEQGTRDGVDFSVENKRLLQDLMEYLIFSLDNEHCDVFATRSDEELTKAVNDYLEFAAGELAFATPDEKDGFLQRARGGYDLTVGNSLAKMFAAAQQMGVKAFIGGAAGVGAFKNDPNAVGQCTGESFKQQGGNMVYIQPGSKHTETIRKGFIKD